MSDVILKEKRDGKGIITINRPQVLNSLDYEASCGLQDAVDEMIADPEVRVIIITGMGEKAFSAGGDIAYESSLDPLQSYRWSQKGHQLAQKLEDCAKPTIAAISGYALGGGFEVALACDFIIVTENAKLGVPESKLGVICALGGNVRLPRWVGPSRAKELLMTGRMVGAEEALRINLCTMIAPNGKLMETVDEFCENILNKNDLVLEFAKRAVNYGIQTDLRTASQFDHAMYATIAATEDKDEGMKAFLEKRKPVWKNK